MYKDLLLLRLVKVVNGWDRNIGKLEFFEEHNIIILIYKVNKCK